VSRNYYRENNDSKSDRLLLRESKAAFQRRTIEIECDKKAAAIVGHLNHKGKTNFHREI
jgi:hypothetical protein